MKAVAMLARALALPGHAVRAADSASLAAILLPQTNLAVWEREEGPLVPSAEALGGIDDISLTVEADTADAALREALAAASYPAAIIAPLARDITAHAGRLADLLDRNTVAIRLEVVETDACRKFHADYVSVRLILTYAGPGTQWLDDADAARLRDGETIETVAIRDIPAGQVALFKGREWAPDGAIVHRSPPIAGTGQRRLVLVIDPAPDQPVPHE